MIRKADIVLLFCLLLAGLGTFWLSTAGSREGTQVRVTVNGEDHATYSLAQDRTVTIRKDGHLNKFSIKKGKVQMDQSNCHNQNCVEMGAISRTGQSIVCLPHRIVIEITGGDYDAVSK